LLKINNFADKSLIKEDLNFEGTKYRKEKNYSGIGLYILSRWFIFVPQILMEGA